MKHAMNHDGDRPTLLITNIDGLLGANLAVSLADRFRVVGLCRSRPLSLHGCETRHCDTLQPRTLAAEIRKATPQWIIHCGPVACGSWDLPEAAPDGDAESRLCLHLAGIAAEAAIRLAVISTDAVFSGPHMFHEEQSAPTNSRAFARAARQVERALEQTTALVVRTHPYGWGLRSTETGFAERAWQAMNDGLPCAFDANLHATPILASDLAELLWRAYRFGLQGLRHIAGAERTSAYRFARELAAAFGLSACPVASEAEECEGEPPDTDRLRETSLGTRRACRELQRPMPMLREGLERFAQQLRNGTRARLRSSRGTGPAHTEAA